MSTSVYFSLKTLRRIYLLRNSFFELIVNFSLLKMTSNHLHRRYLTLQEAVDDALELTGSEEKGIVIFHQRKVMLMLLM